MKKLLIGIVVIAVVLAALLIGAPGLVGKQAEDALRASFDTIEQAGVYKVTVTSYERGWFSSTATSTIEPLGQLADSYDMIMAEFGLPSNDKTWKLTHRLTHGPLLLAGGAPGLGLAQARTEVTPPSDLLQVLAAYLGGSALFTVDTRYGLDGGSHTELTNPPFTGMLENGGSVRWDGIAATLITDGKQVQYDLRSPMLRVETDQNMMMIDSITWTGEQTLHGEHLWLGQSGFAIPDIRFHTPEAGENRFEDITYRADLVRDAAGRIDAASELRVSGGLAGGAEIGETAWTVSLSNLPADAMEQFLAAYGSTTRSLAETGTDPGPALEQLSEKITALFDGQVEFKFAVLSDLEAPDTVVKGDMEIAVAADERGMRVDLRQMVRAFKSDELELTDTTAQLSLTGLNGQALASLYREVLAASTSGLTPEQQEQRVGLAYALSLPALITPDTRLDLNNLTLNVPEGTATATASLGIEGDDPLNVLLPVSIVTRLEGTLSARASESAVLWAVSRDTLDTIRASLEETGREVTDDAVEQLAQTAARGRVNGMLAQALIRREGDDFVVDATLRNGMLVLNGVPRPDLLGGQ